MSTSGIYGLLCDDKFYIGSSADIEGRFRKHKSLLANNKHYSKELQDNYNAGMKVKYKILKRCPIKNLETLEIQYIEQYQSHINGYNLHNHYKGSVQTNEMKEKISETKKLQMSKDIYIYDGDTLVLKVFGIDGLKCLFKDINPNKLSKGITYEKYLIKYKS